MLGLSELVACLVFTQYILKYIKFKYMPTTFHLPYSLSTFNVSHSQERHFSRGKWWGKGSAHGFTGTTFVIHRS